MAEKARRTIQSVDRACEIIEILRTHERLTLTEIANLLDLSPGTVHTYLQTLKQNGYLIQKSSNYLLDPALLTLGEAVRNRLPLYKAAKGEVDRLAHRTGECVHLFTTHNGGILTVYQSFGEEALGQDYYTQRRESVNMILHCTAGGKAILADLPNNEVKRIIDEQGLKQVTPNSITDVDHLMEELDQIRERGYALNDQEHTNAMRAVGSSITDLEKSVKGAISVSGPSSRLQGDRFRSELPRMVMEAANAAEVNLQTTPLKK